MIVGKTKSQPYGGTPELYNIYIDKHAHSAKRLPE
jgi:hypothetical protein